MVHGTSFYFIFLVSTHEPSREDPPWYMETLFNFYFVLIPPMNPVAKTRHGTWNLTFSLRYTISLD